MIYACFIQSSLIILSYIGQLNKDIDFELMKSFN